MMRKVFLAAAVGFVLTIATSPTVNAQTLNEKSTLTVTEPIDVAGVVLQPGTYKIRVVEDVANRNIVQVTSSDEMKVYVTALATPRPVKTNEANPEVQFTYFPPVGDSPKSLRTWIAKDTSVGQDILYPHKRAEELSIASNETLTSYPDETTTEELRTVPLTPVTPDQGVVAEQKTEQPTMVAEAKPPAKLPRTASRQPLLALLGVLSLGGALALRLIARHLA